MIPVIDYLFERTRSTDPRDREIAIEALAPLARRRPELIPIIIAATRDENTDLRTTAIRQLGHLGDAGGVVALEILESGDYPPGELYGLAENVVSSGRIGEALRKKPGHEITTTLIEALYEVYEDDRPELLAPLSGRFREIYGRYRAGGDSGYEPLVRLALAAEEHEFLRELAVDREEPEAARLEVIYAWLEDEKSLQRALAVAETILGRGTERAAFRTRVVESLSPADFDGYSALKKRAVDLMRRVAKTDPSPWVRAAAQKHVPAGEK